MNEAPKFTRSSAVAEETRDTLLSIEIWQIRNIPFEKACNRRMTLTYTQWL